MIKEVAFVGYPVSDMPRARKFYEGVLGLVPDEGFGKSDDEVFIEYTIAGTTLVLGCMPEWKPSADGPNIAFEVDDMDATVKKLKENDVKFAMEVQEFPPCFMAIIFDSEGNKMIIHKRK